MAAVLSITQHTASDTLSGQNPTIAQASNRVAKDVNIVEIVWGDAAATNSITSVVDSDGNTYKRLGHFNLSASGVGQWEIWYCLSIVAGTGTNTITFFFSGTAPTGPEAWVAEGHTTSGSWSAGPFDQGEGASGGSGATPMTTAGVNLASAPTLGMASCISGNGTAITAGAGWTILDALGGSDSSEWQSFASSGRVVATATQGTGSTWSIVAGYFYVAGDIRAKLLPLGI